MRNKKGWILIIGIIFAALSAVGCANDSPTAVAQEFWKALENQNTRAMERVATPEAMAMINAMGDKIQPAIASFGRITNTTEEIDGDSAFVTLTFASGDEQVIDLIRVDGKWRVDAGK